MTTHGQLEMIERWHAAVNVGDARAAGALCTAEVEVGGPRGSGFGRDLAVEWVGHAGIRLEPVRWFCGAAGAVVEQDARWAADGEPTRLATASVCRTAGSAVCCAVPPPPTPSPCSVSGPPTRSRPVSRVEVWPN